MENGALELWDTAKLIAGEDALLSRTTKHTGPIKSLQFNPLRPQVLATAGSKGELYVWDVNDTSTAFRLGTAAAHDIECVAWNRKVSNILATGSAGGFVTVWDLKTKKASLTLNNNRKPVSAIAWDPNNSTNLLTATSDDNTPVILLWNLRNSQAPEKTLQGHDQGVLSLSWCQQDPGLLVSCGKDNRILVWNPQSGERYGEFPEATNWTFLTRFNPINPNLTATASFDGKITIQTLQNTNPSAAPAFQSTLDDDDFFSKAPTQLQGASFSLTRAPVWLERPVGVSFGYGGKLVIVKKSDTRSSKILITSFSVDSDIGSATEKFEQALQSGDIASVCDSHLEAAKSEEEKSDWQLMKTLTESNGQTKIVEYLGYFEDKPSDDAEEEDFLPKEPEATSPKPNGDGATKKHKRVTSMWGDGDEVDDFLSDLAATKGAKTDNPFHLLGEGNTGLEDQVTKAIILGNFEKAANICIKAGRVADALILANCGGKELLEKIQTAYLQEKRGSPSYLRLVSSVTTKNLWDVVHNVNLDNWKEAVVTLCTFAGPAEFPDLCEALGDRIYESGRRKDACFCYLIGSKLEKVVSIWIAELQEAEQAGMKESKDDSTFSVHARSLHQFIEKVTVFRHVTKFSDSELNLTSGWKLASLYDKYTEYADIVAAHGQLSVAQRYLDLLPTNYPAAEVARNRVKLATTKTQKAAPAATATRQVIPAARTSSRAAAPVSFQPTHAAPSVGPSPLNPYAPAAPNLTTVQGSFGHPPGVSQYHHTSTPAPALSPYTSQGQPYVPSGSQGYTPSAPQGYTPATASSYAPPQPNFAPAGPPGPPPRGTGPPKAAKDVGNWNDVPIVTKPPTRKNTPSVAPIISPFPGQSGVQSPPVTGPFQRGAPTPPPPPPKGSAPPRSAASPVGPPPAGNPLNRPSSVSSNSNNPYAPPPPAAGVPGLGHPLNPPPVPRTASPYNPPPSGAPPTNRYAPTPTAQQYAPVAAPPGYTPQGTPAHQYATPPSAARPPVGPPPTSGPPPPAGPPPAAKPSTGPPPRAAAPLKARHPPGDRSHIPPHALELVDILTRDMQRVAAKAPASFAPQVKDTQKRLGLLFDHLNNGELVKPETTDQLAQLAGALASKEYEVAAKIQLDIQRDKTEECGQWMVSTLTVSACMVQH